ncbi:MAG: hypothetical protein J6R22_02795 [Alphaproteobacteria bacterium]|nr:hypothetical protein [Alphaproteobacteria bacterium]
MENESIKPKFKEGETAYIMRHSEIKKVIITECFMVGNDITYCCYISGCKMMVDRISEEYVFKDKAGAIIATLLKMGCVDIEHTRSNEFKITINETEE